MPSLWSDNEEKILETFHLLIDKKIPVSLRRRNAPSRRTQIFQMYEEKGKDYLVLHRPDGIENCEDIVAILAKPEGQPILSFPCPVAYKSETLLATYMPDKIFQIDLRKNPRFNLPKESLATFFVPRRPRVSMCRFEDFSMGGAKLSGFPEAPIGEGSKIGPTTLTIYEEDGQEILAEITVQESVVAWYTELNNEGKCSFGIKFKLNKREEGEMRKHIDSVAQDLIKEF